VDAIDVLAKLRLSPSVPVRSVKNAFVHKVNAFVSSASVKARSAKLIRNAVAHWGNVLIVNVRGFSMRFYIEIFTKSDEALEGYMETSITPEQVAESYVEHPVGTFELEPSMAEHFGFQGLDFEKNDYFLTACREHVDEVYEHDGVSLYPPPMFLPDIFNSDPVRPGENE
jgi:hypothetical protein